MSTISSFKEKVLELVQKLEPEHFLVIQRLHSDVFKELIKTFDNNFNNRVLEAIQKDFRHTFNPGTEQGGDVNRDNMSLVKGEGRVSYKSFKKGGSTLNYDYEVNYIKGSERILIEVNSVWEPGFTGLEQFSSEHSEKFNNFPQSFTDEVNEFGAKYNIKLDMFFTDDTRFKLRLEVI